MSSASNLERQMLRLINEERTKRGLNPLQLELQLNESAEDHSEWMLQRDIFSHTGAGGSSATQRMRDAGFDFTGNWRSGENIAWQSERGASGAADDVAQLHQSLMDSPGHRANILNPDFEYIGIGIEIGNFQGWDAVIVTQNFARTSAPVQLDTGTSPGPVTPKPSTVSPGTVGDSQDDIFVLAAGTAGRLEGKGGNDTLTGQNGRDVLVGGSGHDNLKGQGGNDRVYGNSGDDTLGGNNGADLLDGGHGNDRIFGGYQNDRLFGSFGSDTLDGGRGSDTLDGGNGNDVLKGGTGSDILRGGQGNDTLVGGGGNDILAGNVGNDIMTGGGGADSFVFRPGTDRITDFQDVDRIVLKFADPITGYSDLRNNHMTQSGDDVVINDGLGNRLILEDTLLADLGRDDFIF